MKRLHAYTVVSASTVIALAGCSSAPALSFEDGWDYSLGSSAAWRIGADFDFVTGELTYEDDAAGTGLSLPSTASPEPNALEAALADAKKEACEQYVEPYGDDPLKAQGFDIQMLMVNTLSAAMADAYSDEYVVALEDVRAWVDENGPSIEGAQILSDEYDEISDERNEMGAQRWEDQYPDLTDERDSYVEMNREMRLKMFTSDKVREAQEYFIAQCGIEVSEDYEHPSPEALDITVDEAYVTQLEEANSSSRTP